MMVIRKDQLDALRLNRGLEFERKAVARLEREYPDDYSALGNEGAVQLVRHARVSGEEFGIGDEDGLGVLLQLYIEFGTGLELAPYRQWALDLLAHPNLPGSIKVSLIHGRLTGLTQGRRIVLHPAEAAAS